MEPKLPTSNHGPERLPREHVQSIERAPQPPTPEDRIERGVEQVEQRAETTVVAAPVLPAPVIVSEPPAVVSSEDTIIVGDDVPLVANDDDLIEKEWVDKAKKIIIDTKDDPYQREYRVGKLQADYLRKRYGRELGASQ